MSKVNWTAPMKPQRGVAQRGVVGAPPPVFWWTFRVYGKMSGGEVTYNEGPQGYTQSGGLARIMTLGQLYGSDYVVCGTYLGGYGGKTTYCSYDGGLSTTYGNPPAFPPVPAAPPGPYPFFPLYRTTPRVPYSPFFGPVVVSPFTPIFRGYRTRVTWTAPSPMRFLFGAKRRKMDWLGAAYVPANCWSIPAFKTCTDQSFAAAQTKCYQQQNAAQADPNGPAGLIWQSQFGGDFNKCTEYQNDPGVTACVQQYCNKDQPSTPNPWGVYSADTLALQQEVNAQLALPDPPKAPYGYYPVKEDGKLGPATCGATHDFLPPSEPNECAGHASVKPKPKEAPGGGNPPPPPPPECTATKPCPPGKTCSPEGLCVDVAPPASSTSAGGIGAGGLGLLAAAAAGAIFLAVKAPKLPKTAAGRLQQNRRRKRRRRAA